MFSSLRSANNRKFWVFKFLLVTWVGKEDIASLGWHLNHLDGKKLTWIIVYRSYYSEPLDSTLPYIFSQRIYLLHFHLRILWPYKVKNFKVRKSGIFYFFYVLFWYSSVLRFFSFKYYIGLVCIFLFRFHNLLHS